MQTVRSPLLVLDGDLHVLMANRAFFETYEMSEAAIQGRLLFEVADGQWNVPVLHEALLRVLPEDLEIRDVEVRAELEGLGERVMLVNARQVSSEETGDRDLMLLSLEDVTRQEELERSVQDYTRLLERSNRDLEQFAHAASHDLQEPLRKIGTYVRRLRSEIEEAALGDREQRYLDRMEEAVERLRGRIDDMLRLSRVSRARPDMQTVDLHRLVDGVLEEQSVEIEAQGALVEVEELPTVTGDPSLLHTVFQNLVANALKFHSEGEAARVRIASVRPEEIDDRSIHIEVGDRGIGFDAQYADRIFQPFERLHGVAEYAGSGVGLALCRRVMDHHEGRIFAEPRAGGGARFVVVFPPSPPGGGPRRPTESEAVGGPGAATGPDAAADVATEPAADQPPEASGEPK